LMKRQINLSVNVEKKSSKHAWASHLIFARRVLHAGARKVDN